MIKRFLQFIFKGYIEKCRKEDEQNLEDALKRKRGMAKVVNYQRLPRDDKTSNMFSGVDYGNKSELVASWANGDGSFTYHKVPCSDLSCWICSSFREDKK